jgi:hypothetical protein
MSGEFRIPLGAFKSIEEIKKKHSVMKANYCETIFPTLNNIIFEVIYYIADEYILPFCDQYLIFLIE